MEAPSHATATWNMFMPSFFLGKYVKMTNSFVPVRKLSDGLWRERNELNYPCRRNEGVTRKIWQCIVVGHYVAGVWCKFNSNKEGNYRALPQWNWREVGQQEKGHGQCLLAHTQTLCHDGQHKVSLLPAKVNQSRPMSCVFRHKLRSHCGTVVPDALFAKYLRPGSISWPFVLIFVLSYRVVCVAEGDDNCFFACCCSEETVKIIFTCGFFCVMITYTIYTICINQDTTLFRQQSLCVYLEFIEFLEFTHWVTIYRQ